MITKRLAKFLLGVHLSVSLMVLPFGAAAEAPENVLLAQPDRKSVQRPLP